MNKTKNIAKILLIILVLTITNMVNVNAAFSISSAYLYSKGSYGSMITYHGIEVLTTFVVYNKDGVEYPAYCLDANMPGVGESGSYTVNINSLLNDAMLWRIITNGYPYKTPAELRM